MNHILYPCSTKQKANGFVLHLQKADAAISLVIISNRKYYVYCYGGNLNRIENTAVSVILKISKRPACFYQYGYFPDHMEELDRYVEGDLWKYFPSKDNTI